MIHTVKGFSVINETDVYLEFLFFLYDPFNVSNLNSGFFAFSKPSLYILKFSIQVLLKPSWKDLGHNLTSMGSELNCPVVWTFFSTALLENWMNTDLFQSCGHFWVFQICWHIECSTLIASSFRSLNSSAAIPSHPLALLAAVFLKVHLTSCCRMSGSRWVTIMFIWVIKTFFVQFYVFLLSLLDLFCFF